MTFAHIGDILPMHTHDETTAHVTIVARGQIEMRTAKTLDGESETHQLKEGYLVDTPPGIYHEFIAKTDGARIFNMIRHPRSPVAGS